MEIKVGLNGKITLMQAPGHVRIHAVPNAFHVLCSVRDDEPLSTSYQVSQLRKGFVLRVLSDRPGGADFSSIQRGWFTHDWFNACHGYMKEIFFGISVPFNILRALLRHFFYPVGRQWNRSFGKEIF
jgi:hypothetical protein